MIYKIVFPNGKAYVGQAVFPRRRMWEHKTNKSGKHRGQTRLALHHAIAKYGWSSTRVECLCECAEEELDDMERRMTDDHNTATPSGYNVQEGGHRNLMMSAEVRERWEHSMESARPKAIQARMERREAALAKLGVEDAEVLRKKLDGTNARQQALRRGEEPPDGRFGPNDKRRVHWEAKRQEKMASMTPEDAEKYRKRCARSKKSAAARWQNKEQNTPERIEYMKQYRKAKGKKPSLKDAA